MKKVFSFVAVPNALKHRNSLYYNELHASSPRRGTLGGGPGAFLGVLLIFCSLAACLADFPLDPAGEDPSYENTLPASGDIMVIPFKTSYTSAQGIDPANDLAVYARNLSTGVMLPLAAGKFSLTINGAVPSNPLGADGGSPRIVTVTVAAANYPGGRVAGDASTGYNIWVDTAVTSLTPVLMVIPFKTSYTSAEDINPANDLAVYARDLSTGGMLPLAPDKFSLTIDGAAPPSPLGTTGGSPRTIKVTVAAANYPGDVAGDTTADYNIWVDTAAPPIVTPEIQVIPFKTSYPSAESIDKAADLAVYIKNLTTGVMERLVPAKFSLTIDGAPPPSPLGTAGGNPREVTVTVLPGDFPGKSVPTTAKYHIWVDAPSPYITPALMVVPQRTSYNEGGTIDHTADLVVYKRAAGGSIQSAYPFGDTGYKLYNNTDEIIPGTTPLSAGTLTITVKDAVDPATIPAVYSITVTVRAVTTLNFYYADHTGADPDGQMVRDDSGAYRLRRSETIPYPQGKVIHSVVPINPATGEAFAGKTCLLGRKDTEAVLLNLDAENGNLSFRPAVGGSIPIGSVAELTKIGESSGTKAGTYALEASIDLLGFAGYQPLNWGSSMADIYYFTGTFDGGGFLLDNLSGGGGLFSYVYGGVIRNVIVAGTITASSLAGGVVQTLTGGGTLENCENRVNVSSSGNEIGGVVGQLVKGTLENCENRADVSGGGERIGGVVGGISTTSAKGILINCRNFGNVSGSGGEIGGVVGHVENANSSLTNCSNAGMVTQTGSKDYTGGVAGYVDKATLNGCRNSGEVSSNGNYTGGVVGYAYRNKSMYDDGYVGNCDNSGTVTQTGTGQHTGGVVGSAAGVLLENCRNQAKVSGGDNTGGVAGSFVADTTQLDFIYSAGPISDCTNSGLVEGTANTGGIVGFIKGQKIENCQNQAKVSGGANTGGITGKVESGYALYGHSGLHKGEVNLCFNYGKVETAGNGAIGGVAGLVTADCTITVCVNYGPVSGIGNAGGVAGKVDGSGSVVTDCRWLKYSTGPTYGIGGDPTSNASGVAEPY